MDELLKQFEPDPASPVDKQLQRLAHGLVKEVVKRAPQCTEAAAGLLKFREVVDLFDRAIKQGADKQG